MKIDEVEVRHVARLARLELTEEEADLFRSQLDSILRYMDKLRELDTSGVAPTSHVIPLQSAFRPDRVGTPISRESALANAPDEENGCFKVPRIVG